VKKRKKKRGEEEARRHGGAEGQQFDPSLLLSFHPPAPKEVPT
jgi:hypothetical protein